MRGRILRRNSNSALHLGQVTTCVPWMKGISLDEAILLYKRRSTLWLAVAGKQTKILSLGDVGDLVFASCTRHPLRNRVIVLLAAKAGLRAVEIANLTWDMALDPTGDVGLVIELRDYAAKNGSGRLIPVHPDLREALAAYRNLSTGVGPVIRSERGGSAMTRWPTRYSCSFATSPTGDLVGCR